MTSKRPVTTRDAVRDVNDGPLYWSVLGMPALTPINANLGSFEREFVRLK